MKNLIKIISLIALLTGSINAAEITGARIDGDKLLIDVVHGGGCGEHLYDIEIGGCFETMPVQCTAELIHVTDDYCEAILYRTVEIDLVEKGLDDRYFRGGSLTILGDKDWSTGERSKATVTIPN